MLILLSPEIKKVRRIAWMKDAFCQIGPDLVIVESPSGEREMKSQFPALALEQLNEHSSQNDLQKLAKLAAEKRVAILSDGGSPCVGDPGSNLVRLCHKSQVEVRQRGANSYVLASLILSGCEANSFRFHGYPPRKTEERVKFFRHLAGSDGGTHVLMEPPYRSLRLLREILQSFPKPAFHSEDAWMSFSQDLGESSEKTWAGTPSQWTTWLQNAEKNFGTKPLGIAVVQFPRASFSRR